MPFSGRDLGQLMYLHLQQPAPPARQVRPALSRDLETIALKCLEKSPNQRYRDCQALADDLRRWLEGEPVLVRPPGLGERLLLWVKKEPTLAAAVAVAVGLLVAMAITLQISARQQAAFAAA